MLHLQLGGGVAECFGLTAFVNCLQSNCKQLTKAVELKRPATPPPV